MKLDSMEPPPFLKRSPLHNTPKLVILSALTLIVFTAFPLYHHSTHNPIFLQDSPPSFPSSPLSNTSLPSSSLPPEEPPPPQEAVCGSNLTSELAEDCDVFSGEWVPNPEGPYYTNGTCRTIQDHQNCMRNGRPDTGYLKWRWKPSQCELPLFNPSEFFEIMKGKSLAFVGDSVARNQMQSLLCLLSRVASPVDISDTKDENFKRWFYGDYNVTIEIFWSPYLVRTSQPHPRDRAHFNFYNLYLDEFDESWTTKIHKFDYVIVSAGQWFFRPAMFYENGHVVGCLYCHDKGVKDLTKFYGYRKAFRTAFQAINRLHLFNGTIFLRTFAPSHFENGVWNQGGTCRRTRPYKSNETKLDDDHLEYHAIQIEEFREAKREGVSRGMKFRLMDATKVMLLRPDGHPGIYGQMQRANMTVYNDCVHWCLPGPIDAWNDILLYMLKMEVAQACRDRVGRLHNSDEELKG